MGQGREVFAGLLMGFVFVGGKLLIDIVKHWEAGRTPIELSLSIVVFMQPLFQQAIVFIKPADSV